MGRDEKRLIKALLQQYVTPTQARMAAIILACNGIEAALEYVSSLASAAPGRAVVPFEAAEYAYLDSLAGEDDARDGSTI